jgi:hypothetical protein
MTTVQIETLRGEVQLLRTLTHKKNNTSYVNDHAQGNTSITPGNISEEVVGAHYRMIT